MIRSLLSTAAAGFLMGTADLVPGVSGGTIALVLRIYERLVASIREGSSALGSLIRADVSSLKTHWGKVEWLFLLPLLAGIGAAVILLSSFLEHQLEERPIALSAAFFGLVLGSVGVAWRMIRVPRPALAVVAIGVGIVLFVSLGLGEGSDIAAPSLWAFFGAGALAICAMILPGISGSLLLVLVGMYAAVLGAVNDRDWLRVGVFVGGAVIGLTLFSQFLKWALDRHHDLVLAGLVGLMAGSVRILWPWPDGVDSADLGAPSGDVTVALIAALIGLLVVLVISRLSEHSALSKRSSPSG